LTYHTQIKLFQPWAH